MHDDRHRERVLDDPDDPAAIEHVRTCAPCADLADRVRAVRRIAPTLAAAPAPRDVADDVLARLTAAGAFVAARRRRALHALAPRLAIAAAVVATLAVVLPSARRTDPSTDLADALLVSAQTTEDTGSARLHLDGVTEVRTPADTVTVTFGGVGAITESKLRYRGLTRVGDVLVPCELTVIGSDAWTRRADGMWLRVDEPVGALAPVVLDAGSILELLRMPKENVRLVDEDGATRIVAFEVTGRPGLVYDVVAAVGRDDSLLRQVDITATTDEWSTRASMHLYGFGEPVTIRAPAAAEVAGTWIEPDASAIPTGALFPVG